MGRQPYIPLYIGDYLKDTRVLPLNVRGAWVDIILFMWDNPTRGELVGTIEEVARMIGCDVSEARFALDLLKQKKTADIDLLPTGEFKIVSRRMKKDYEISQKRSEAGKNGVNAKKNKAFASAKVQAKHKQNTEYDIDNEVDNEKEIEEEKELNSKLEIFEALFSDELYIGDLTRTHKGKDLNQAFEECYTHHSNAPNPPTELWQWRQKLNTWLTIKKKDLHNGTSKEINGNIGTGHINNLVEGHKRRYHKSS